MSWSGLGTENLHPVALAKLHCLTARNENMLGCPLGGSKTKLCPDYFQNNQVKQAFTLMKWVNK